MKKSLATLVAEAVDEVTGSPFLTDMSDNDIVALIALYSGCMIDLQNEWTRREILKLVERGT